MGKIVTVAIDPFSLDIGSEYLIRCETKRYSYTIDADLDQYGTTPPQLVHYHYKIVKRTRCGAWIDTGIDNKFVLLTARKKYACETECEALESLLARKHRHARILRHKLQDVEEDIALAQQEVRKWEK